MKERLTLTLQQRMGILALLDFSDRMITLIDLYVDVIDADNLEAIYDRALDGSIEDLVKLNRIFGTNPVQTSPLGGSNNLKSGE